MKKLLKPFDYFFILKPILFYPVWALFMAGYYVQNQYIAPYRFSSNNGAVHLAGRGFLWIGLAVTFLMGAVFVLHQVMDRNSAKTNDKLFLIAPGFLTPRAAFIEAAVFIAIALITGFIFSLKIGLVFFLILLFAGILYSFSPFNWKDKVVPALFTNVFAAFLIFTSGWLINGSINRDLMIYSVPYVCFLAALFMYNSGYLNATTKSKSANPVAGLSIATALYTGLFFELVAVLVAFILQDELIFYPSFFALPFFVWGAFSLKNSEIERTLKYAILFLALTISFKWGIVFSGYTLFFAIVGIYYLAKIYYKLRFGVNYPTLAVHTGEAAP